MQMQSLLNGTIKQLTFSHALRCVFLYRADPVDSDCIKMERGKDLSDFERAFIVESLVLGA